MLGRPVCGCVGGSSSPVPGGGAGRGPLSAAGQGQSQGEGAGEGEAAQGEGEGRGLRPRGVQGEPLVYTQKALIVSDPCGLFVCLLLWLSLSAWPLSDCV